MWCVCCVYVCGIVLCLYVRCVVCMMCVWNMRGVCAVCMRVRGVFVCEVYVCIYVCVGQGSEPGMEGAPGQALTWLLVRTVPALCVIYTHYL